MDSFQNQQCIFQKGRRQWCWKATVVLALVKTVLIKGEYQPVGTVQKSAKDPCSDTLVHLIQNKTTMLCSSASKESDTDAEYDSASSYADDFDEYEDDFELSGKPE